MSAGLLLCDDLIFISKVTGTARALGLEVKAARDSAALLTLARQAPPSCVLIDLHNPGLDLPALLAFLLVQTGEETQGGGPSGHVPPTIVPDGDEDRRTV